MKNTIVELLQVPILIPSKLLAEFEIEFQKTFTSDYHKNMVDNPNMHYSPKYNEISNEFIVAIYIKKTDIEKFKEMMKKFKNIKHPL